MAGLADLALGTAPIAGGFLLAMVTGQFKTPTKPKAPDFRGMIKKSSVGSRKSKPPAALNCSTPSMSASMTSSMPFTAAAARFARGSALIGATGATWCCLFALCCSQSSGGTCRTAKQTGSRPSSS
jgi:hypothetical protein